jgi:hypothetical protein
MSSDEHDERDRWCDHPTLQEDCLSERSRNCTACGATLLEMLQGVGGIFRRDPPRLGLDPDDRAAIALALRRSRRAALTSKDIDATVGELEHVATLSQRDFHLESIDRLVARITHSSARKLSKNVHGLAKVLRAVRDIEAEPVLGYAVCRAHGPALRETWERWLADSAAILAAVERIEGRPRPPGRGGRPVEEARVLLGDRVGRVLLEHGFRPSGPVAAQVFSVLRRAAFGLPLQDPQRAVARAARRAKRKDPRTG